MVVNLKKFVNMKVKTKTKSKVLTADEKRLQSIAAKKKEYKSNQNAIKTALANIDVTTNKKVIFDDQESDVEDGKELTLMKNGITSGKQNLFDDSDNESENNYNFDVKEQFQGEKGKKLLGLQSKYKNDRRFTLDERFLEDDEKPGSDNEDPLKIDEQETGIIENEFAEEKQTELAILEEVLGKRVRKKSEEVKKTSRKSMVRYDASKPEHANLEIKSVATKVSKKRKQRETEKATEEENIDEVLPEVSKETFYEVRQNLKESMQENQPFSLLNMFGRDNEQEKEIQLQETTSSEVIEKNTLSKDKNPFRYDSSDNESGNEDKGATEAVNESKETEQPSVSQTHVNLGPRKLWAEPFFFKDDDYRVQEGFDFVRKFEIEDKDFSKIRRNIKEIVKAKVRHNLRKNRPFKKKLGGSKKMIKMKKAMKR